MFSFKASLTALLVLACQSGGDGALWLPAVAAPAADSSGPVAVAANSPNDSEISSSSSSSSSRSAPLSFQSEDLVNIHRRHIDLLHRLLQDSSNSSNTSSTVCQAEAAATTACVEANLGAANSTERAECLACFDLKAEEIFDFLQNSPTYECAALSETACGPVAECPCLEPCDGEISASTDCALHSVFAEAGFPLNCTISCKGTNVTTDTPEDDSTANDDFVGGLCAGEEAGVKLCLESTGSSLESCSSCLETAPSVDVTNATTCEELQANACTQINACPCVENCKTEMVAYWNCEIDFATYLDLPQLSDCDLIEQCPSGGGSEADSSNSTSSSSVCQAEVAATTACLETKVGLANSTEGSECMACYRLKQEEALDDFRNDPTLECDAITDIVCRPVSECPCLEPCDDEISASADCSLNAEFAEGGVDLNCTAISCKGTNATAVAPGDDSTANDDFVGGLCAGEEAGVKLCLEETGSSLESCSSCLDKIPSANVTNATTCEDLQASTCTRINACPCFGDCRTAMVAFLNCDIDFNALDFPQLNDCDLSEQCPSAGGSSAMPSPSPSPSLSQSQSQSPSGGGTSAMASLSPSPSQSQSPAPATATDGSGAPSSPSSPPQQPSPGGGQSEGPGTTTSAAAAAAPSCMARFRAAAILASSVAAAATATAAVLS